MKYLIVGGVAGGASAAARLRRLDENAEIILFERGKYVSYANCGLPYYIGGTISERDKLFVQTKEGFEQRFNIDIRNEQEVIAIHPEEHTVEVRRVISGEVYTESYDKLVLSPGADPIRPNLPYAHPHVLTLRTVPDTDAIKTLVDEGKVKHAVVIGGGFIGLEMAENLVDRGVEVHLVEATPQVMAPIDFSMAALVHKELADHGVQLHLNTMADIELPEQGSTTPVQVLLKGSGERLATDLVVFCVGVRPETQLAEAAGLKLGETRGIWVDEYLRTSDKDIYATGDAIEVTHAVTGRPARIPLAGPANKQGRIVANNIVLGDREKYEGTLGTSVAKVFGLTVAATGASAKLLEREGIPFLSSWTHGASHAGYYPDALNLSIKILFNPETGRLLGAQAVGYDGVDKRMEMLSGVLQRGGTVRDLAELEQAYAPPYSSAKDPVNMAGFVAENILTGKVRTKTWSEISTLGEEFVRLDVRTPEEYACGTLPSFINIPVDELRNRLDEIPQNRPIIVTCAVGLRGYLASRILTQKGFTEVYNLSGGCRTWTTANGTPSVACFTGSCAPEDEPATETIQVDACGLMCPGPILQLKKHYEEMAVGETLQITATDSAFATDVEAWSQSVGAKLVSVNQASGKVTAVVQKETPTETPSSTAQPLDGQTLIVFSDDLDRALASFVIANGAAAMGKKVTMFFTFWGLNVIKKENKPATQKDIFGKMFSMMLPSHSKRLALSKWNMFGAGSWMMRLIMKRKNIDSLESLRQQAIDNGVEMIACTMSMDVMGVKQEELLDNVTLGGVAAYLGKAEKSGNNLFI